MTTFIALLRASCDDPDFMNAGRFVPDQSSNLRDRLRKLFAIALIAVISSCTTQSSSQVEITNLDDAPTLPPPPRAAAHADTAHGVVIPDEYRWMETARDEQLDRWIDAEDAYARAVIASLPGRASLRARIAELWRSGSGDVDETLLNERAGRMLVMEYSLDRPRLGVRDQGGSLRILFDPAAEGPEKGASVRQAATVLSPDGRHATVGLVERGEAKPRLRIIDVATGQWLPETLSPPLWADAQGFHIAWLPDSEHLLWVRNPSRTDLTPNQE